TPRAYRLPDLVEVPNAIHGQLPAVASVIGLDPESEFLFVMTAKQDVLSLDLGSGRVDTVAAGIVQAALGPDRTLYSVAAKRGAPNPASPSSTATTAARSMAWRSLHRRPRSVSIRWDGGSWRGPRSGTRRGSSTCR